MEEFGFDKNPLHLACALGEQQELAELIANGAYLCGVIGDRENTLLHIAAEYGHVSILEMLLSTKAASHILTKDYEGDTPIHVATDNIDAFRVLYDKFYSENPNMHVDDDKLRNGKKRTLLHYAAGKGELEVVRFLLEVNANKSACDIYGGTPFHFAARCGSVWVMELLIHDDIDLANDKGRTALHYASWNGRNQAVRWLLKKGASVSKTDANGDTALHWAARSQVLEVFFTLLMQPDANVFAANKAGQSPLSLALHNPKGVANAEIVKRICTAMEESNSLRRHCHSFYMARYKDGATLLHYAAAYGDEKVVIRFFSYTRIATVTKKDGRDSNFVAIVNSKHNNGNNPFHWAAMNGNSLVMKALKFYGVDPLAKNKEDRTPFLLALINNHLDCAKNLAKCLGKDLTDEIWMEDIGMWTDTFIDESLIQRFKFHMRKFNLMPGGLQDKDIKEDIPFVYKALYARKEEHTINFIQEISNVNKAGKLTGRTPLHWATILNQKEIVFRLCRQYPLNLVAFVANKDGKTPLTYATDAEIWRELMKRPDVKSYTKLQYRDMDRYVSACNAILVSAALIVSVTFAGWLHPCPSASGLENVLDFQRVIVLLCNCNRGCSGFCCYTKSLYGPIRGSNQHSQVIESCCCLIGVFYFFFAFCAFAATGFIVLPLSSWYRKYLICGIAPGGLLCLYFIWKCFDGLYKVRFRPSPPEAQPAKSELHKSRSSSPQSDGRDSYRLGTQYEYFPWDDGLDN